MNPKINYNFIVGYYVFHELANINFQLNRLVSSGVSAEEVKLVAPKINNFDDWKREMINLAENALSRGETLQVAMCYRAAEFFTSPEDPDKELLYDKFTEFFYKSNPEVKTLKHEVPYEGSYLPSIYLASEHSSGTIIIHGGYDSFYEEYYTMGSYFKDAGYNVIIFEGPGQGATLIKNKITMTHEWEKPIGAIIDFFKPSNITLLSVSLGGYLGLRAAAFEPRISKVIAFNVIYDFFQVLLHAGGPKVQEMLASLLDDEAEALINKTMRRLMKSQLIVNWGVNHGMRVFGVKTPYEYIQKARLFTTAEISELIEQHVLLTAGTNDHFVPIEMFYKQIEALKNVKSLTCRLFTEKEHAANHCQIGNRKLAIDFMINWIEITK